MVSAQKGRVGLFTRRGQTAALLLCLGGCTDEMPAEVAPDLAMGAMPRKLDPMLAWAGDNRARIDRVIAEYAPGGAKYNASRPPVAMLDWDNTILKNDIGDATLFWMIQNSKVRQPEGKNWRRTSAFLTVDAAMALDKACDALAPAGAPLPTSTDAACATELVTVYTKGKTTGGKEAFSGWNRRRMEPTYAWAAQLQAGYTSAESREFAKQALAQGLMAAQGATQKIGSVDGLTAWLRIYAQQKDLIETLKANRWDVWVVSASPEPWVQEGAAQVGIATDHVIGIRMREEQGKLTANLRGCGDVPDGENDGAGNVKGNGLITYIDGKRCWINKIVYGDDSPAALAKTADPTRRQAFAAGDSDTDVTFMQDATELKLVINRHKKELLCNALRNVGSKWLINPMFIEPSPVPTTPYKCSVDACKDAAGNAMVCQDEDGAPIPDQTEPAGMP